MAYAKQKNRIFECTFGKKESSSNQYSAKKENKPKIKEVKNYNLKNELSNKLALKLKFSNHHLTCMDLIE